MKKSLYLNKGNNLGKYNAISESDFTFVIPVKNEEKNITSCIESICTATQLSKIIVIDDCSTDRTLETLRRVRNKQLRVIQSDGSGISSALNTGIQNTETKYFLRLDADDSCSPNRVKDLVAYLETRDPDVVFTAAKIEPLISGLLRPRFLRISGAKNLPWLLLISNVLIHPTVCIDLEKFKDGIEYRSEKGIEDYLLWIELILKNRKFSYLPDISTTYKRSTDSISSLRERKHIVFSETAIKLFSEFQQRFLGKNNRTGIESALSGGARCLSVKKLTRYYLQVIKRAPLRVLPNLILNILLLIAKTIVFKIQSFYKIEAYTKVSKKH